MDNIYLPVDNINEFDCYVIQDKDTIRAYKNMPNLNSTSDYVDFYINSHYLEKKGNQSWGNYSQYLPTCISSAAITNNFYYRNDFLDILLIFSIFVIFTIFLPIKVFGRLFRRFL